jgi:hypothetical protein
MMNTPTGVDADNVVTVSVQLSAPNGSDFATETQWRAFADQHATILDQVRRHTGVTAVGATNTLPLQLAWRLPYELDGEAPTRADDRLIGQFQTVSEGYFESMQAPLVMGRAFSSFDTYTAAPVVMVNETFVNRHRWQRPHNGRPSSADEYHDGRSSRPKPDGDASSTGIDNAACGGRVRHHRCGQGRAERTARSIGGASGLFQREAVSLSRDVPDGPRV